MSTDPRSDLITAARHFYAQGWMWGTAGNLSARLPDRTIWITASGRSKGELTIEDLIRVDDMGNVIERSHPALKPSAETEIHQVVYCLFPEVQACFHVHSVEANLVSRFTFKDTLRLPPLEMIKGLGIPQEHSGCELPIFTNHAVVAEIAEAIRDRFTVQKPQIPALLIRDHGVTVWGTSLINTRHAVELIEYIFRYMVAARQTRILHEY
jgi:methylthioribulose-1-phosphate dehydratase